MGAERIGVIAGAIFVLLAFVARVTLDITGLLFVGVGASLRPTIPDMMSSSATVGALDVPLGTRRCDLGVLGVVGVFFGFRGLSNVLFFGRSVALGVLSITLALVGAHGLLVGLPGKLILVKPFSWICLTSFPRSSSRST